MKFWVLLTFVLVSAGTAGVWFVASFSEQIDEPKTAAEIEAEKIKEAELDLAKQKIIWQAEHVTFEIEQRFGKALLRELKKGDRTRMASFFRENFRGTVPHVPSVVSRKSSLVSEVHKEVESSTRDANADDVIATLLAPTAEFKKIERSRLRVLQIERIDQTDRWQSQLLVTMDGFGMKGGRMHFESEHAVEFRIIDELAVDKIPVIDRWNTKSETLRTSPRLLMEEVTEQLGLTQVSIPDNWKLLLSKRKQYRFQTAVADFDRDGDLDIAVASIDQKPILLQSNSATHYRDIAHDVGVVLPPGTDSNPQFTDVLRKSSVGWIDYDNDGFPDLLVGERLYRNLGGKRFEDVTIRAGLTVDRDCMGCVVADFDCDGLLDLYLLYQKPYGEVSSLRYVGDTDSGEENQLWRNEGRGRFRNVTRESGSGGGKRATHAAAWFFLDDDRFPDLYIANDFGSNVILRNRGDGTFENVSKKTDASDFATSMGVAVGDIDNNGKTDVYVANMYSKMGRRIIGQVCDEDYPNGIYEQIKGSCAGNRLYLQGSDLRFREESDSMGVNAVGWAYAPAMVDLDGDGWLDLYATSGFMSSDRNEPDG